MNGMASQGTTETPHIANSTVVVQQSWPSVDAHASWTLQAHGGGVTGKTSSRYARWLSTHARASV